MPHSRLAPSTGRAEGCLVWPNVSGRLSTACAARPSLHAWRAKKEIYFLPAPTSWLTGQGETVVGGGRQNGVGAGGVLMEEEGTRPTTEGEGKGWRPKRRRKRVPCHAFIQHSRTTDQHQPSVFCVNCTRSVRNSHWFSQEGNQQNKESVPLFCPFCPKLHLPFLAHFSLSFVDPQTHPAPQSEPQNWILWPSWITTE